MATEKKYQRKAGSAPKKKPGARVGNPSRTANKPKRNSPVKKRPAEPPNRENTAVKKAIKKGAADRKSVNPPNRKKTAAKAVGNAPNEKKTKYIDVESLRKTKGKGPVVRSGGEPEYRSSDTPSGLHEVEDYGRGIRYTKFGERNTTYGKTGTFQTTYGKGGSQTTRKIGKRTAADVRGSEGPKRRSATTSKRRASAGSEGPKIRVRRRG